MGIATVLPTPGMRSHARVVDGQLNAADEAFKTRLEALSTMRVSQLKRLLKTRGVDCIACVVKVDYIERVRQQWMPETPSFRAIAEAKWKSEEMEREEQEITTTETLQALEDRNHNHKRA